MTDVEDLTDVRAELSEVLVAAREGDVSQEAVVGLLTEQLAGMRGSVRLPLSMPPDRAREFTDRAADHVGETMEVELLVSEDVVADLELQLGAFDREGDTGGADGTAD